MKNNRIRILSQLIVFSLVCAMISSTGVSSIRAYKPQTPPVMQAITPLGASNGSEWQVLTGTVDLVYDFDDPEGDLEYLELDFSPDPYTVDRAQVTLLATTDMGLDAGTLTILAAIGIVPAYDEDAQRWTITIDSDALAPVEYLAEVSSLFPWVTASGDPIWPAGKFHFYIEAGDVEGNTWGDMMSPPEYAHYIYYFHDMQTLLDDVSAGGEITLSPGILGGGYELTTPGLTVKLNGATVEPGSPAFTIAADDITIQGPGTLDGGGSSDPGILVLAGADNFILDRVEVTDWQDGIEVAGSVTSFKVVSSWLHDNSNAGLKINNGTLIDGVVTIEGNLFKANGDAGIQNDSGNPVEAEYNSWGSSAGPGVLPDVDADPYNYYEIYFDMDPGTTDEQGIRELGVGEDLDVSLMAEAVNVYGMSFRFSYDPANFTLQTTTFAPEWTDDGGGFGRCEQISAPAGTIEYFCTRLYSDNEWQGGEIAKFTFAVNYTAIESFFDIYAEATPLPLDALTPTAGAKGSVKVWVNNAGYGEPSASGRDITDADDGKVILQDIPNYSGFVDLQGRVNDSGAVVQVYDVMEKSASVVMADASSASSGAYITAHKSPNVLMINTVYYLFIDRDLYLPTTIMGIDHNVIPNPIIPDEWSHSALLWKYHYTPLSTVLLLGGDATNDDVIDVLDAGCIGGGYALAPKACGSGGTSDVNEDGVVDTLDLSLMAGNFTLNFSPWIP